MAERYRVVLAAGSLRDGVAATWSAPHAWTDEGVVVEGAFTGAHLLHAAIGGCVLNDAYREAAARQVVLRGVRVEVEGGFDAAWTSTGVRYRVELDTDAAEADVAALLARVDEVAEIPRAVRAGPPVERAP